MKFPNVLLAALVIVVAGCSKNSNTNTAVRFQLQTINRSSSILRTTAGNIQWTSGYGSATDIKFEAETANTEVERKSHVAQKLDLLSTISTLGDVNLTPATYDEVEFKVELNPNGSDAAMQLEGQFTSNGVVTPVVFRVDGMLELKNEKKNVIVTDNSVYTAITTIDLSVLTRGVTEAMLNNAVRTGGKIIISSSVNSSIYNIILNNIDDSDEVEFERD